MINSSLGLVIIFAVQHQVASLSVDVQHRTTHRKHNIIKRLQDIQKRAEALENPIENYDLIITEPPERTTGTPKIRYHHHHHTGHPSGKGANVTIKNNKRHIPLKDANKLRKHYNQTGETNKTNQEDRAVTTRNYLNEDGRAETVATTKTQEHKYVATSENPVKTHHNVLHVDPFYRRVNYFADQERKKPQKWVHCLDLVAPRLKGYEDNMHPKIITNYHNDIKRLSELLSLDVSKYTEEEIVSVLFQISNIDLRLFQWDYSAISVILNVIIAGSKHNFRTLKAGVKFLFDRWHLDISSMRTVLDQTRIFRPPCIDISGSSGFTKKAGGILLYTKPDKSTKKPRGGDESCHSRETTTVNNNNNDRYANG